MIRLDYFSKQLYEIKVKILEEAREKLDKRLTHYKLMMGNYFDRLNKSVSNGFKGKIVSREPQSCVVYNKNPFNLKYCARANKTPKESSAVLQADHK